MILTALVAVCALPQCRKSGSPDDRPGAHLGQRKADELTIGPHRIAIPAGWRDVTELPDLPGMLQPPAGGAVLVQDVRTNERFGANMVFMWAPNPPGWRFTTCDLLAAQTGRELRAETSDVKTLTPDGDTACRWRMATVKAAGIAAIRLQGDHQFLAQCQTAREGDPEAERACEGVLAQLRLGD